MSRKYLLKASIILVGCFFVASIAAQEAETFELETERTDTVNGTEILEAEGYYVAPTGGYSIVSEDINVENETVEVIIEIEGPEEDEMVTQALTNLTFSVEREFEDLENHTVEKKLYVDEENLFGKSVTTVDTGSETSRNTLLEPLWDLVFSAFNFN